MKLATFLSIAIFPAIVNATGLAISINNLHIENQDDKDINITIPNLAKNKNKFNIPAHSICRINSPIMFLPVEASNGVFDNGNFDYVIAIETSETKNSIIMDSNGLSLASYSNIKANYDGNVKNYNLLGYCNENLLQTKNLNVIPHDNESSIPDFHLSQCQNTSNYIYVINDNNPNKITKIAKTIKPNSIAICQNI